jgi:hypothetical protein
VVEAAGAKRARAAYRKTFIVEFVLALSDSRGSHEIYRCGAGVPPH